MHSGGVGGRSIDARIASLSGPGGSVYNNKRKGGNVRGEITEEQKQELKEAFELFDEHKTGRIDYHELKTIMKALGFEVTKQHVLEAMRQYDPSGTGYISYNDFISLMTEKIVTRDPMEEIALAFKLFDDDDSGRITEEKLKRVALQLGEDLTDEEIKSMIEEFDKDMDGAIDHKEFAAIMSQAALF